MATKIISSGAWHYSYFLLGKPAELTDDMNPDWVPSVNMGYRLQLKSFGSKSSNKRIALKTEVTEEVRLKIQDVLNVL